MKIDTLWSQFSDRQFRYLANVIEHTGDGSICEIGAFAGSVARAIWPAAKIKNRSLYLVDNYLFLPEKLRLPFFKMVKKTVSEDDRIHLILEDSHQYDWSAHDFIIFSHADYDHMAKDFKTLINLKNKSVALDLTLNCMQRTNLVLSAIKESILIPKFYIDGLLICGDDVECTLPLDHGDFLGHPVRYASKQKGSYNKAINQILSKLRMV
jgi:hypothetical protein